MTTEKVCSNDHFLKLLKQFKKISCRVIVDHKDSKYYKLLCDFAFGDFMNKSPLNHILDDLFKNFKAKPIKTKSGIIDEMCSEYMNKFYVTYTFQNDQGKRSINPSFIVFRIYIKIGYFRKKRLVKWSVPIIWN
jgi:hypothetical protein